MPIKWMLGLLQHQPVKGRRLGHGVGPQSPTAIEGNPAFSHALQITFVGAYIYTACNKVMKPFMFSLFFFQHSWGALYTIYNMI